MIPPLLEVRHLEKRFWRNGRELVALDDVSFSLASGETLAVVGPSGSGKSTLARLVLRLAEPSGGSIRFAGADWLALGGRKLRQARADMQAVFQDPLAAFNPRATVAKAITDPLRIHRVVPARERAERVREHLARVGLDAALAQRAIHELSGGQRQRVAIARALATRPKLIVLDEATSALDVSVRGSILNLLKELQASEQIAYLFISHDLAVVQAIAHRLIVMNEGRVVEEGSPHDVIRNPVSPTAQALVAAVPRLPSKGSHP